MGKTDENIFEDILTFMGKLMKIFLKIFWILDFLSEIPLKEND